MTSSLPAEAREAFQRFITCEYTTVGDGLQPITWPVTPYYSDGAPTIDASTGLGYPKKADDTAAHPSVSMLFSDPTGSGIDSGIQVLVHGTAEVDDADLDANRERYFTESNLKLPATRRMHPPKAVRGLFNWYYTRIYMKVRPERVFIWPDGDISREPVIHDAHLEEVRSGHSEEPPAEHGGTPRGEAVWDERVDALAADPTGVLSWLAPDGFPIAVRVPIRLDRPGRTIEIGAEPAGLPVLEGRACLTVHRHAPDFTWQRNFQIRGELRRGSDGLRLTPRKLVGGFELPEGFLARNRAFLSGFVKFRRTAKRRLAERQAS